MQITVAALNAAPELRGLAHDLREISDHVDLLADTLQFPEPADPAAEEVYDDLMVTAGQTTAVVARLREAAETVGFAT